MIFGSTATHFPEGEELSDNWKEALKNGYSQFYPYTVLGYFLVDSTMYIAIHVMKGKKMYGPAIKALLRLMDSHTKVALKAETFSEHAYRLLLKRGFIYNEDQTTYYKGF